MKYILEVVYGIMTSKEEIIELLKDNFTIDKDETNTYITINTLEDLMNLIKIIESNNINIHEDRAIVLGHNKQGIPVIIVYEDYID
jgi:hypothetical protein